MDADKVHILVKRSIREDKANILWAVAKFPRATIVIVHVHWPSEWMPCLGTGFSYKFAYKKEKEMHIARETEAIVKMLKQYKSLCGKREVRAYYLPHADIVSGIVNLIKELKIKRIVIDSSMNDHQEYTGSIGQGGNSDISASVDEQGDESDVHSFTTPPSDFLDEITDEEEFFEMDDSEQLVTLDEITDEEEFFEMDDSEQLVTLDEITDEEEFFEMDDSEQLVTELQFGEATTSRFPRYPELLIPDHIKKFSMSQIGEATSNFAEENLIGKGGYGRVYRGKLGGMPVAIKLLRPRGSEGQGFPQYKQEVVVLSRSEHRHIVRLIGVCPEWCGLVYEHVPNGTLEDRFKGLSWEERIRILTEQRSALAYLHSSRPYAIIHADIKLANILIDAGNISRLGDFGIAREVHVKPLEEETISRCTTPVGTVGYMDPIFSATGELTTESDVYAFGVVILQLLTGLQACNIANEVRETVTKHGVNRVLDASAGAWPEKATEGLVNLALRCCSQDRKRRPAITSDAWRSLDILLVMANPANKSRKWNFLAAN
ncbi:hypothetical protein ACP70R_033397 [Stipagrostis hirtigluma subsp. patula]